MNEPSPVDFGVQVAQTGLDEHRHGVVDGRQAEKLDYVRLLGQRQKDLRLYLNA